MSKRKHSFLLFGVFFCSQWGIYAQKTHQIISIIGSTGNQLEVLDWGGTGNAILFLTGLGNTAHIYDDFALRFTHEYHSVYNESKGIWYFRTNKGRVHYRHVGHGYLSVIDTLKMDKVILIGHSIAGDEMTTFATQYPNRTLSLVYLDAAYDHSDLDALPFPDFPEESDNDSLTVQDLNEDLKRTRGFVYPEDELKHQYVFSDQGFQLESVTPEKSPMPFAKG